jgi:alkylhydroperoxidase family enzyme
VDYSVFGTLTGPRTSPESPFPVRIPDWTPEAVPRDTALIDSIRARRGGKLINLDLALLWSEPLARGWNELLRAVRREFAISPRVKEIAICTVARLTGADYEFTHHWPEYVKAGGNEALRAQLDDPVAAARDARFPDEERLAMRYAIAMTREVRVPGELFDEVRRRFDETGVVELTAAIAAYNMVARFLVALEVENEIR